MTFRSQSWSQTGNHRTTWKSLHRSYAVKECTFLQSVGPVSSAVVVCSGEKMCYLGVCCVYLGVKSADTNELAQISSQPSRDFTSFVGDFKVLSTLLPLVSPRVCSKAGGVYASDGMFTPKLTVVLFVLVLLLSISFCFFCFPEAFSGPSNLQFSGQTSDSLTFYWSEAGGPVSAYMVQYVPLSGLGQPITAELRQVSPRTPVIEHHRSMDLSSSLWSSSFVYVILSLHTCVINVRVLFGF